MIRPRVLLVTLLTLAAALFHSASAAPVTVPSDLSLGAQYRLAFVTSTSTDATSTNINDYNQFVTNVAATVPELVALSTTWKAIGSTDSIDAHDNTGTNPSSSTGVPIYLLNNTRIANDNAGLWSGILLNTLGITETGAAVATTVWTGTNIDGTVFDNNGFSPPSGLGDLPQPVQGVSNGFLSNWIVITSEPPSLQHSLYAMSDILTVVPEPTSLFLTLTATALLALTPRRRAV